MFRKHLFHLPLWARMGKLNRRTITKIPWDNMQMERPFLRKSKHIKTRMELIELHNKECLTIKAERLWNKSEEIILNKQTIIITLIKKRFNDSTMIGKEQIISSNLQKTIKSILEMQPKGQIKIGCLDTSQEINTGMEEETPNFKEEINYLKMRGEINHLKMKGVI